MFTYFLMGEDSSQRLERLTLTQSAVSSYTAPADGLAVNDRADASTLPDALREPARPGADRAGLPPESRRPPLLPRCDHGHSCDVASDLAMESIFPNFRRSLAASSKRRRFRHHRSATDAAMSYSLQDCSVHDATTAPLRRNGRVVRRETTPSTPSTPSHGSARPTSPRRDDYR